MKRILIVIVLLVFFSLPVQASASENAYFDELKDAVGWDVQQYLSDIGIENGSYEELLNIDFGNVLNQLLRLCRNEMNAPLKTALYVCILLLILSVIRTIVTADAQTEQLLSSVGTVMIAFVLLLPVAETLTSVLSAFDSTYAFIKVLIPVFAGIITAIGKPSLAVCLQGAVFATAQVIASFFSASLPTVCVVYSSLNICSCTSNGINTGKLAQLLKNFYLSFLAFCAALFSSLLTVKSVIAASADTVSVKGIKFIIGNAVPVVGGALSEALNSVISGIALLKSSIGIVAIIILIFMNLPTLIELLLWSIAMKVLSAIASVTDMNREVELLDGTAGLFLILSSVVIYQTFLYVISVSIVAVVAGMR